MQSGYTSFENSLRRILRILDESLPEGEDWHADLIGRVSREIKDNRPAILTEETAALADEARRFRHVAMRNYNNFRTEQAGVAVEAVRKLIDRMVPEVKRFRDIIDPPKNDGGGDGAGGGAGGGPHRRVTP